MKRSRIVDRAWAALALSALLATVSTAAGKDSPTPTPVGGEVKAGPTGVAHWVQRPTAHDFERLFPLHAQHATICGWAELQCSIAQDGHMKDCFVLGEYPAGEDFGQASVKMSRVFQMQMNDGSAFSAGAFVKIPIRYNMVGCTNR